MRPAPGHALLRLARRSCLALAGLAACSGPPTANPAATAGAPSASAKPIAASTRPAAPKPAFCDLETRPDKAAFHWPQLAGPAPAAAPAWRWVNVWATWCEPCVEEMPKLAAWMSRLAAAGKRVELSLVSVDDTDADVEAFRAAHPGTPPSLRITSPDQRTAWLASFGLGDGALPLQLFISPTNQLRCARAGGLREQDYAAIEQLVTE